MTTLAAPAGNEIQNTLAATYTRGTDTTVTLTDGTAFPSSVHVIRIQDGTKWCLKLYESKATHVLTLVDTEAGAASDALAKNVTVGDEAHAFAIGSTVELVCAADEIAQLFAGVAANVQTPIAQNVDVAGYDFSDMGVLNYDDATELTISVAETARLACDVAWDDRTGGSCACTADADDPDTGAGDSAKMALTDDWASPRLLASEGLVAIDITGSSVIRVWMKCSVACDAGDFQLVIDDTADCASPIQHCDIPALAAATWTEVDIHYNPILTGMDAVISFGLFEVADKEDASFLIHELRTAVGSVTATQSYHKIDTESGSEAETYLDTINEGVAGDILYLRAENTARSVVLAHDTGNILCTDQSAFGLFDTTRIAKLIYDGTNWHLANNNNQTKVMAKAFLATNQAGVGAGAWTEIELDATEFDPLGMFNSGTHRIAVPLTGYYLIVGLVAFTGVNSPGRFLISIKNNTTGIFLGSPSVHSSSSNPLSIPVLLITRATAGDTFSLFTNQQGTGADLIAAGSVAGSECSMIIYLVSEG